MAEHFERIVEELLEAGWVDDDAREEARRRFGDAARFVDACEREDDGMLDRLGAALDELRLNLGFAVRQMVRQPVPHGLAVVTLALGITATVLVFSVVHAVILKPLPFPESDRLMQVSQTSPQGRVYSISEPNFVDFSDRQTSFSQMAGMGFGQGVLRPAEGEAENVDVMRVSAPFFSLLGTGFAAGRPFLEEEDLQNSAPVLVLSEGAWTRRFGRAADVIGTTVVLDGIAREVVGVAETDVAWPGVEIFLPLAPEPLEERDNQIIESFGRLLPGVTLEMARADLDAIAASLSSEYPQSNDGWGAHVRPFEGFFVSSTLTSRGYVLLGAVGLLLLMACVSVMNIRIAHASARVQEMGVRSALGAGHGRIVRQLLAEGSVLGLIGGGVALLVSLWGLPLIKSLGPTDVARLSDASINLPVLIAAGIAAVLTVIVAGLAPAFVVARGDIHGAMRTSSRGGGSGNGLRDALVAVQFALAVTVVLSAGLLFRSFTTLAGRDLGFEPDGMARFHVRLPDDRFTRAERALYVERLSAELEALPGVTSASVSHAQPFGWMTPGNFVARSDQEPDRQQDFQHVSWRAVSSGFFETYGISIVAGRDFTADDHRPEQAGQSGVLIDERLANILWPEGNAVGQRLTWFMPGGGQAEVLGIVENVVDERIEAEARPRIYRTYAWGAWYEPAVLVRTQGDPSNQISALREATLRVDPSVPAMDPTPVRVDVRSVFAWPRFTLQVFSAFSLAALLLAALGIYGVTAFQVARRRREIGLRVALGAEPGSVFRLVMRRALTLSILGVSLGLGLAFLASRLLATLLYQTSTSDPLTYLATPLVLFGVAALASWYPASRALKIRPREALTSE